MLSKLITPFWFHFQRAIEIQGYTCLNRFGPDTDADVSILFQRRMVEILLIKVEWKTNKANGNWWMFNLIKCNEGKVNICYSNVIFQ